MAKTPNYTVAMTDAIVAAYVANPTAETVEQLATEHGKSTRSIIAKLVREQVYITPAKPESKARDEGPSKAELFAMLESLGVNVDGLDGATKAGLETVIGLAQSAVASADAD